MKTRTYCVRKMVNLRPPVSDRPTRTEAQVLVVVAYYAQQDLPERDFVTELKLLVESATRTGRPALAAAARAILDDWQASNLDED